MLAMRARCGAMGALMGAAMLLGSCAGRSPAATGPAAEADRIVQVVATAIGYPRQGTAAGLARAALATNAGRDGRLSVLAAEDLAAGDPSEPFARLVFLVRVDGSTAGDPSADPFVACYEADFNYYGAVDEPREMDCPPPDPDWSVPPAPQPDPTLPPDVPTRLQAALEALPAADRADPASVHAAVGQLAPAPASIEVVAGDGGAAPGAVGVAIRLGEDCVLARVASAVEVWIPPRISLEPGEIGCDAHAAAAGQAQRSPH
jgi:hypothetical protein